MRHQEVQETRSSNLGDAVLRRHQKVRRQRHGLPRDHEGVCIVGKQDESHACQEQVVLQAQKARRRALATAKVTGREDGNARCGRAEQEQEETRERVEPHVGRQIGQADEQRPLLGRRAKARRGHQRNSHSTQRPQGEQRPSDEPKTRWPQEARESDEAPEGEERQAGAER